MDFKDFYQHIYFNIDGKQNKILKATQGDTKSRGFYVTLLVNNVVVEVTDQTLYFYAEKPDKTRVFVEAVKDTYKDKSVFRIDLPNQTFAQTGDLSCQMVLYGTDGEKISEDKFRMRIGESLIEGSLLSKDERGIVDILMNFAEETIPRIELIDIDLLEEATELKQDFNQHKLDYAEHLDNTMPHLVEDLQLTKTYKFGLQLSVEGNPQIIFEEVVI